MFRFPQRDERNIKRTASKVVHQKAAAGAMLALGAVAISELDGCRRWFIHHSQHGKAAGIRGRLGEEALIAVGIGWNSNHGL